ELQTRAPIDTRERQRPCEAAAARPYRGQAQQCKLATQRQDRRAAEILNQSVVSSCVALMKFVKRDEAAICRDHVDGQHQIVSASDTIIRDDKRIGKHYDSPFAVRIIDQQRATVMRSEEHTSELQSPY